ncbi:MAG: TonB-dependent receptor, partial [Bryobacteraceae bacterium]
MIRSITALLLGALCVCPLVAQNIGASLSGLVEDSQKRVIQNAAVSVQDRSTDRELMLRSGQDGRFHASGLTPGEYRVEVASPGFATVNFESVKLAIGESRTLRVTLSPELSRQEITVSAEAATSISADDSQAGKSYGPALMGELPMISGGQGRNFKTQAYLTPGVTPSTEAHRPFSVAGARNRNNNYLIDSNDYNEIEGGLMMGRGLSEQLIPSESIEGMQVLTHNFKAEYGRQNGSIISLISKRGSNEFHGLLYEYLRNDSVNARNTFDRTAPPLKYNHFGVNAGGPIVKDKLFFFGNYEGSRQRSGSARTIQTLTADQRARAVPAVRSLVSMYPEPNIPGGNLFRANVNQTASLDTFLIRADYNASERHRIFSRSTFLTTDTDIFAGAAVSQGRRDIGSQGHSLHHTWSPGASVLNEARFNFTRFHIGDGFVDPVQLGDPALNGEVGSVFVNGLTFLGHFSWYGQKNYQNNFQWSDDLSIVSGRHVWKTGVAVRR